ncbi:MAG: ferrous iron transport protein A [Candidatus Latescibacteria bacterium]|nr:ferrous iron transport protein A [Candidatus Latescibacterota bacterium]
MAAETAMRQRLMDLGIIEGVKVEMVRSAPFGDPLLIRVRNTILALRRSEARQITIDYFGKRKHAGYRRRFGWKSKLR